MSKKAVQKARTQVKHAAVPGATTSPRAKHGAGRTGTTPGSFFRDHWKPLAVISLLAFALYIQTVSYEYVLDDTILISENKFTQKGIAGIPDIFRYESFKGHFGDQNEMVEGGRYRPLSIATFAVEKSLFGDNPGIAHFINVLLYMLTGIFLYRVLLMMFPAGRNFRWYFSIPFVAVMLFIAHPLHVEVVGNVKGRDEILALLAEAGVLYYSFRYLSSKKISSLLLSFACFFLGILSKEGVITFLAVVPLTAYFFTRSSARDKFMIMVPMLAASFIYLVMRYNAIGHLFSGAEITNIMNNPFYGMTFGEKTATIFYTLLLYLKLLVFPHPLTHDYYPYHIPKMEWSDWAPILSLVLHLTMAMVAIRGFRRKTIPSYSILFYLVTLSIVSNLFISIGTFMNERFLYHSSLGFCLAVAWLLVDRLNRNEMIRRIAIGVFAVATIAFSAKTLARLPDWRNIEALDRSALKVSPGSARANHFFGVLIWGRNYLTLPADAPPERRRAVLDSVKPYFDRALEILPTYNSANSMKAGVAAEYHKLNQDYEALIRAFEEVNYTGTYEKFILEYLHYINKRVANLDDARKLEVFYGKMIRYYDAAFKNTVLPGEYRSLLSELQERMKLMNPAG
ncbi:MAG TPA: hypothetical protein VFZ78_07310 [Flavisolibacter sp.]